MGGKGGGERPPPRADACEVLRIETNLMSPQMDAIKSVGAGQTLPVKLEHSQANRYVVVLNTSGQIIGTVGSDRAINLIECIDKGYVYCADILSIEGGACRVLVHLKAR